ncbi:hypothetical protein HAX54_044210 [Datura stramonium]|uniref:Uncharacterized protein n=1 Tax=Datura stramonium TaxID=4076 RepID=A0ABS8SPA8_DATST|nr:hypothetical protein [Datura stramonium]
MAASCSCAAKLEDELRAYGMKLMNPPSSTDELLNLLDKVESLLKMICQHPSDSTRTALQPVMKALIRNEILRHTNEDVKVSVVSCITELSRITAPKYPYDDHKQMEEILMHTVMALKKLPDVCGRSYRKVVRILETVAKLRACVMLLDFQNDTLVIEIFKVFLGIIRPYHPHNIFTRMKEIMTQLIEDSDELSVELLRPLLESVTIENQMASPISSKLGEKVLEECAAIVRPYLSEALKSMSLGPYDAEIVVSICNKMPKGEEMEWCLLTGGIYNRQGGNMKMYPFFWVVGGLEKKQELRKGRLMDSKRARAIKNHGEELVGAKIKVWWPLDEAEQLKDTRTTKPENLDDGTKAEVILARRNKLTGLTVGERNKHTLCAKRKPGRDSRKNESASNCEAEGKAEFSMKSEEVSLQQIHGMKQRKKKTAIKIYDFEESGDKVDNKTA